MTPDFDPVDLCDSVVHERSERIERANEKQAARSFEEHAYHGAVALTGACVLLRFTGIESVEQASNWCGGLATVALMSATIVSPEHRSLAVGLRDLVEEFKNPIMHSVSSSPKVTLEQLKRQEARELDTRKSLWFWDKWTSAEDQ